MRLLEGKLLAAQLLSTITFPDNTSLHVILIGDDPSSVKYVDLKKQKCLEKNIDFQLHHLPSDTSANTIISLIEKLNKDPEVSAFFIQLPMPSHLNKNEIISYISPTKDVDGLTKNSPFTSAVALAVIKILENIDKKNKNIVVVNDSDLIGQPLKRILEKESTVTLCNEKTLDLKSVTKNADILISATGVKNLITPDYVKEGSVVIDVANGDVDFAAVAPHTSYITPTFGSIGPLTIACLLLNLHLVSTNKL